MTLSGIAGAKKCPSKTLILHIGSEKTGSKSIRISLARSANYLLHHHQIHYPRKAPLFLRNAHYPIVSPFLDTFGQDFVSAKDRITKDDLREALAALDKPCSPRTLLLSAEHLSSRLEPDAIVALCNVLRSALPRYEIKILYHVRNQASQYCAALSTHIKSLGLDLKPAASVTRSERFLDHFKIATDWAAAFGKENIIIQNYHAGDAVKVFYRALGVDPNDRRIVKPSRRNTSLSLQQATILLAVNSAFGEPDFTDEPLIRLRRHVQGSLTYYLSVVLQEETPLGSILTLSDREHFRREFGESNDGLQHDFGLAFNLNDFPDVERFDFASDATARARYMKEFKYWRGFVGQGPLSKKEAVQTARRLRLLLLGKHIRQLLALRSQALKVSRERAGRI